MFDARDNLLSGTDILLQSVGDPSLPQQTFTTDGNGHYQFNNLLANTYAIRAQNSIGTSDPVFVDVFSGTTSTVDLVVFIESIPALRPPRACPCANTGQALRPRIIVHAPSLYRGLGYLFPINFAHTGVLKGLISYVTRPEHGYRGEGALAFLTLDSRYPTMQGGRMEATTVGEPGEPG